MLVWLIDSSWIFGWQASAEILNYAWTNVVSKANSESLNNKWRAKGWVRRAEAQGISNSELYLLWYLCDILTMTSELYVNWPWNTWNVISCFIVRYLLQATFAMCTQVRSQILLFLLPFRWQRQLVRRGETSIKALESMNPLLLWCMLSVWVTCHVLHLFFNVSPSFPKTNNKTLHQPYGWHLKCISESFQVCATGCWSNTTRTSHCGAGLQNGQRFLQAWKRCQSWDLDRHFDLLQELVWKPSRTTVFTASISLCKFPPATLQHAKTLENQVPSISFCRLAIRSSRVSTCANHKNRPDPSWPSPADHFSGSLAVHSSVSFARYLEIWNHEASMNRSILFHINIRIPHEANL